MSNMLGVAQCGVENSEGIAVRRTLRVRVPEPPGDRSAQRHFVVCAVAVLGAIGYSGCLSGVSDGLCKWFGFNLGLRVGWEGTMSAMTTQNAGALDAGQPLQLPDEFLDALIDQYRNGQVEVDRVWGGSSPR